MKSLRIIIVVVVLAALAVGYFYYLSNKKNEDSFNSEETTVSDVFYAINYNLEANYPQSPKEVIEFYVLLQRCMYNEEYSESEFVDMINQMRLLLDDELTAADTFSQQYDELSVEVIEKKNTGTILNECTIGNNSDVTYATLDGLKYANVPCTYYFKNDEGTVSSSQEFILRKDEDGKWKILGSSLAADNER